MISDLNYLKTMSGGDANFIGEMISLFREQVEEYSEQMPALLKKGDYDSLAKLAHKAKSSVAVMGMKKVSELLKELEILANERKDIDRYESMVLHFIEQSQLALIELDNETI